MELQVISAKNLPERGLFALRAGSLRRQAQLTGLEQRTWEIPSSPSQPGLIKVEVLESVGVGRHQYEEATQDGVSFAMTLDGQRGPMEVTFKLKPKDGQSPAVDDGTLSPDSSPTARARHKVSIAAQKYLDEHSLHAYFQYVLQRLLREKPPEPYEFLKTEFANAAPLEPIALKSSPPAKYEPAERAELSAEAKVKTLVEEHPYIARDESHPLHETLKHVHKCLEDSKHDEAEDALKKIASGLEDMTCTAKEAAQGVASDEADAFGPSGTLSAVGEKLKKLIQENPYLEPNRSVHTHTLHHWVLRCRDALRAGKEDEAEHHFSKVSVGLEADKKQITEAYRRFDADGSGHLDADESKHMCAYLGWAPEEVSMMDMNQDGKLTVTDFVAFVGRMGGVQRLFELRRQRVAHSRTDVISVMAAAVNVGSRVRAYFYINGEKSQNWQEAVVLKVGVPLKAGSSEQGVMLEFGFLSSKDGVRWKARQVVPSRWVISSVEDASVAAALREVGMLDEQQSFWNAILPQSEMREIERLVSCQRHALAYIRTQATASHEAAMPELRTRFESLGFGEYELQAVLSWIQDLAPVVVHVHIDNVGQFMEIDEFYRNQFETKTSCGALDDGNETRMGWEKELFGDAYDDAKPFDRCKYGALGVMNDYRGVTSAMQYGDSYMVLKDARLRCTFAATDSGGIHGSRLAVLDKYAHVLKEYNDQEIKGLVGVATAEESGAPPQLLRGASEDPTNNWLTLGFPALQQAKGRFYFEVELHEDCQSPQVGLLSSQFKATPYVNSTSGVGDDEHGWAVDGQHAARWHKGHANAWGVTWPRKGSGNTGLAKKIVVGIAVDMDARQMWASSDGVWEESPAFTGDDIPEGTLVYPALSVQGRAGFIFGPEFKHGPPSEKGSFEKWPNTPGGHARIDCPRLGNSDILDIYKEAQIHGEVCFKRHVQRLVANSKYRERPKTHRSWGLSLSNAGTCDGTYERMGAHNKAPLYQSSDGGVIFWEPSESKWCINSEAKYDTWRFSAAQPVDAEFEPPRAGWSVPPEEQGYVAVDIFKSVAVANGIDASVVEQLVATLSKTNDDGQAMFYKVLGDATFQNQLEKLAGGSGDKAGAIWDKIVDSVQNKFLSDAGFANATVVQTEHPYPAKAYSWKKSVRLEGAGSLAVHFASKCCTYDSCAPCTILPTSVHRDSAGIGARLEVQSPGGATCGTVSEKRDGGTFKVRLDGDGDNFAICPEEPSNLIVQYFDGATVGSEIADFILDKTCPITPISIGSFAGPGPAQQAGVQAGWFLDLAGTLFGPSASEIAGLEGEGLGEAPSDMEDALQNLDEVHKRLQALKALSNVSLVFTNGARSRLLTEAHACYGPDSKIGDEIAAFGCDDYGNMFVSEFKASGPAQAAGVRIGWKLNLEKTLGSENPGTVPVIEQDILLTSLPECPDFVAISDVTLIFERPANDSSAQQDAVQRYGSSWESATIQGDSAEFQFATDGDGAHYPDQRWGFFALVLPTTAGEPPPREDIDKLVAGYTAATLRARGLTKLPEVIKTGWDESRLRSLCKRHGWDFEWMTEDGERKRRAHERQGRITKAQVETKLRSKGSSSQPDGYTVM